MKSRTTRDFRELYASLPPQVRQQARKAYTLFQDDPEHPSLRFKKVHAKAPIYSARVSGDYRSVGVVQGDTIAWFWIGSHADYDQLLRRL